MTPLHPQPSTLVWRATDGPRCELRSPWYATSRSRRNGLSAATVYQRQRPALLYISHGPWRLSIETREPGPQPAVVIQLFDKRLFQQKQCGAWSASTGPAATPAGRTDLHRQPRPRVVPISNEALVRRPARRLRLDAWQPARQRTRCLSQVTHGYASPAATPGSALSWQWTLVPVVASGGTPAVARRSLQAPPTPATVRLVNSTAALLSRSRRDLLGRCGQATRTAAGRHQTYHCIDRAGRAFILHRRSRPGRSARPMASCALASGATSSSTCWAAAPGRGGAGAGHCAANLWGPPTATTPHTIHPSAGSPATALASPSCGAVILHDDRRARTSATGKRTGTPARRGSARPAQPAARAARPGQAVGAAGECLAPPGCRALDSSRSD